MRRSVCYCEPNIATAGATSHWKFIYTTATSLPKGTKLRFDMHSKGRAIDWQLPRVSLKEKENAIWLELPNGQSIAAVQLAPTGPLWEPSFEFTLPSEAKTGESITIHLGTPTADNATLGNRCQLSTQRRRFFHLYIDPKGKGDYRDPEVFALDVRGNALHRLRPIAPSLVSRNQRFDIIVRFEDLFGNLTSNAPEETLIELSYEHLRDTLSWKLFVPGTGVIALPNLYFNETGIYKIQLRNLKTQELFFSPPIKCIGETVGNLYWGQLHGEVEKSDAAENIESYLRHVRDDLTFQFCATSSFDTEQETSADVWKGIVQQITEFNEEERFVAFLGFQWIGESENEGQRQFIYSKDAKPLLRSTDAKSSSLKKIYKGHTPKDLLAILATPLRVEATYPEFERLVEIYTAWGSAECLEKEGNIRPLVGKKLSLSKESTVRQALNRGMRLGFVAGGFDDRGPYQGLFDAGQEQYSAGLTSILAKDQTRASLFEALYNRSCYATTGEKMIIGISIAGAPMGAEIDVKARPGLEFNRHVTGYVLGTKPLTEVALIRNGTVIKTFDCSSDRIEFAWDDSDRFNRTALTPQEEGYPFIYYYLRATQEDGNIAWSSPIWVSSSDAKSASVATNGKKSKK